MNKTEILNYLAETLSFSRTKKKYTFLDDEGLKTLLHEAASSFDNAPIPHKATTSERLIFYIDGASRGNPGKAAIGIVIMNSEGHEIGEKGKYIGDTTNNVAEYQSLIEALTEGRRLGGKYIQVYSDSELLVRQINGVYKVKDSKLKELYGEALRLISSLKEFKISHVTRDKNALADSLANQALDNHIKRAVT